MDSLEKKLTICLALGLFIAIFVPLYGMREPARQEAAGTRIRAEMAERGAEVFASSCVACHGKTGDAVPGRNLRDTRLDEAGLARTLSRGLPGTAMPAFSNEEGGPLKKEQISDVVVFLKNWDQSRVDSAVARLAPKPAPVVPPPGVTPAPATPAPAPPKPAVSPGPAPAPVASAQGRTLFDQKCRACHSIGGGRLVGPDLKGIGQQRDTAWLIAFIVAPEKLLAQGDPLARQLLQQYGVPMPNMGVSEPDAREILAYIQAQSVAAPPPTPSPGQVTTPAPTAAPPPVLAGNAGLGRDLFTGEVPMKNRGGSCISCHSVSGIGALGGGTVGKDLTKSHTTLTGPGLAAVLKSPPFPIMREIYASQPLTDEEVANLVAFLAETSRGEATGQGPGVLLAIGVAGMLVFIGIALFYWRGRLLGVRRYVVKGVSK